VNLFFYFRIVNAAQGADARAAHSACTTSQVIRRHKKTMRVLVNLFFYFRIVNAAQGADARAAHSACTTSSCPGGGR
jgi:hypothetical protein